MGFLDFLNLVFGKPSVEEKTEVLSLNAALARLEDLEKKSLELEHAENVCSETLEKKRALEHAAKALAEKEISPATTGCKIAVAMRLNFLARVPKALKEVTPPANYSYEEVSAFQAKLDHALVELTKAVSDNRYLFALFEPEMRAFASHAKELAAANESLQTKLREKHATKQKISAAQKALEEIRHSDEYIAKTKGEAKQLEQETKHLESEVERAAEESEAAGRDVRGLEREIAEAETELKKLKARIAQHFAGLPRVLRKLAKITADVELEELAAAYQHPVEAFKADQGAGLRKLLPALAKALEEGAVERDRRTAAKIASELDELSSAVASGALEREFAEIDSLEERISGIETSIESKASSIKRKEVALSKLNAAKAREQELRERISAEEEKKSVIVSRAEGLFRELSGREVKIVRE